jgi:hypothetical protein
MVSLIRDACQLVRRYRMGGSLLAVGTGRGLGDAFSKHGCTSRSMSAHRQSFQQYKDWRRIEAILRSSRPQIAWVTGGHLSLKLTIDIAPACGSGCFVEMKQTLNSEEQETPDVDRRDSRFNWQSKDDVIVRERVIGTPTPL